MTHVSGEIENNVDTADQVIDDVIASNISADHFDAIGNALKGLGFSDIGEVRQGKLIEIDLAEGDPAAARARVEEMCRQLLANPVIETYAIDIG